MSAACPICSDKNTVLITEELRFGKKAQVLKCGNCGMVFLDQASFSFPKDFYENEYHQTYLAHIEPAALDPRNYYEKMLKATKPWSDRLRGLLTGNETVLDFGCSTGHVMASIQDRAARIYGHELNRREVDFCKKELGLDVSGEDLESRFGEETFDLICMIFVLEHIGAPIELLKHLRKFLKPGGRIVILVPNVMDPLLNLYRIPSFPGFYFCIEHLFYFSPSTLSEVLTRAGLQGQIETVQEYPITNHLNWAYRQRPSDTLSARRLMPDVPLQDETLAPEYERFWNEVDGMYKHFLAKHHLGDRIWCVAGRETEKNASDKI